MNIILLGPPGAGKGTQAKRLEATLGLPQISSGDIFRSMSLLETPEAQKIRAYQESGRLVPDDVTIDIILDRLHQPDARTGFILDGFPRTIPQAEALDQKLELEGKKVDLTLSISVPVEVLVARIAGRMTCPHCGAIYNAETNPPKVDMICDVCGHQVVRREDERPEVVNAWKRISGKPSHLWTTIVAGTCWSRWTAHCPSTTWKPKSTRLSARGP